MLTEAQEKYLQKIPGNKMVKIIPFDPRTTDVVQEIRDQIKDAGIDLEVGFIGAAALGISGQNDIDLAIYCPEQDFLAYVPKLEKLFGSTLEGKKHIRWQFERDGYEVEIWLVDKNWPSTQEQIRVFEILKSNQELLKEYEEIKLSAHGKSFRQYMRVKYEFFNKILNY